MISLFVCDQQNLILECNCWHNEEKLFLRYKKIASSEYKYEFESTEKLSI